MRLRELAGSRTRYDYRRLTVMLRREGWKVNAKRIYRLYREEQLHVRTAKRTRRGDCQCVRLPEATCPNQRWSMDFVSDRLADGRWFRILTIVDQYTREASSTWPTKRGNPNRQFVMTAAVFTIQSLPELNCGLSN